MCFVTLRRRQRQQRPHGRTRPALSPDKSRKSKAFGLGAFRSLELQMRNYKSRLTEAGMTETTRPKLWSAPSVPQHCSVSLSPAHPSEAMNALKTRRRGVVHVFHQILLLMFEPWCQHPCTYGHRCPECNQERQMPQQGEWGPPKPFLPQCAFQKPSHALWWRLPVPFPREFHFYRFVTTSGHILHLSKRDTF